MSFDVGGVVVPEKVWKETLSLFTVLDEFFKSYGVEEDFTPVEEIRSAYFRVMKASNEEMLKHIQTGGGNEVQGKEVQ
jgi:hypothetical protein